MNNRVKERSKTGKILARAGYLLSMMTMLWFCNEVLAFDLDKGIKAGTEPFIKGIQDHWGKAVALGATVGAMIGEGDLRTRALKAGIGAGVAGGAVLAILGVFL